MSAVAWYNFIQLNRSFSIDSFQTRVHQILLFLCVWYSISNSAAATNSVVMKPHIKFRSCIYFFYQLIRYYFSCLIMLSIHFQHFGVKCPVLPLFCEGSSTKSRWNASSRQTTVVTLESIPCSA